MLKLENRIMEQELIDLLKKNLRIEVFHPLHKVGYYSTHYEEDAENVSVRIYYGDILISESTSC